MKRRRDGQCAVGYTGLESALREAGLALFPCYTWLILSFGRSAQNPAHA